jgi:hypothetical protein
MIVISRQVEADHPPEPVGAPIPVWIGIDSVEPVRILC